MLVALRDLASTQAKAYENTYDYVVWILNYSSSHPMAIICYKESDMVLQTHAD